jgi:hypothetical protein
MLDRPSRRARRAKWQRDYRQRQRDVADDCSSRDQRRGLDMLVA